MARCLPGDYLTYTLTMTNVGELPTSTTRYNTITVSAPGAHDLRLGQPCTVADLAGRDLVLYGHPWQRPGDHALLHGAGHQTAH